MTIWQSRNIPQSNRRSGGREARRTVRAAPLADELRPVRAGMTGGTFRPLDSAAVGAIEDAVFQILEEIGLSQAPESGVAYMTDVGAIAGDDGRIRFPRPVVRKLLAIAARNITLNAQNPKHDLLLSGSRVHFGTAGAAVHVVDVQNNAYRESHLADIYDAARIVENMDNIHFFQRPMVARDIEDPAALDLNTLYACCGGTTKHIGTSFSEPHHVKGCMDLLHMIAGGEKQWRARPFVSNSNCFVVPPMKFATESCETMEKCIEGGMPILLLSAGQAGATAPAPIALAIVQAVAECLAGIVYVNSVKPGHPCIFGTWPFVSDLRTGAMSGGSGEQALLTAGCAQMHHFLGLPGGAASGIADSKLPDMQAGWEQGISNTLAGLAGLNLCYESVGMHASLLGFSLESLILGNDILGQVQRCIKGIDVNDDIINIDVIRSVCIDGPEHYLGHQQTLDLMQKEYIYPDLADRTSPKEWQENNKPDIMKKTIERKKEILTRRNNIPLFDKEIDRGIREKFKIYV